MIVIFRWWFFAGMAGLASGVYGTMELDLALRASPEPVPMELAALEAGELPAQPHIRIGAHVAQYDRGISFSRGDRVKSFFYPITLTSAAGPGRRNVVVKTNAFKHLAEVPDAQQTVTGLRGILTTADRLTSKDRDAVLRMVGVRDAKAVAVLEAHRRPKEALECVIWLVSGCLLLLLAIHLFRARRRRERSEATAGMI